MFILSECKVNDIFRDQFVHCYLVHLGHQKQVVVAGVQRDYTIVPTEMEHFGGMTLEAREETFVL